MYENWCETIAAVQHLNNRYAPMLDQIPSTFWKGVFYQWCCYNYTNIDDIKTLGKEILWYNSNIKIGHRLLYYKELYEKNVLYVSDLFNANNKFMSYIELKKI